MATGESAYRKDAAAKVTGRAQFTGDLCRPGMLWAAYLRSTIAHGRVTGIDTAAARALPGVAGVFTFRDVPEKNLPLPDTPCPWTRPAGMWRTGGCSPARSGFWAMRSLLWRLWMKPRQGPHAG